MTYSETLDELLGIAFGDVLEDGIGVLVSMVVRTHVEGQVREGARDPMVIDYSTLETVGGFMPALFKLMEELGIAKDLIQPPALAVPWNAGPALEREVRTGMYLCTGFGFREMDSSSRGAIAVIEVQSMLHPESEPFVADYVVPYRTLQELAEAIPKVQRRMLKKGAQPSGSLH